MKHVRGHPERMSAPREEASQKQTAADRGEGGQPKVDDCTEKKMTLVFFIVIWKYFLPI